MSHYVTPFLIINIGTEMIFVISQRLQAQNIPHKRSTIVLDELITTLLSDKFITNLIKPQATYSHEEVRLIIEDISQSSFMRLDTVSMNKLWDLITMVFKWQLTMSDDLIKLTLRHLYELETYTINPNTHKQIVKVQNLIDDLKKILNPRDINQLRDDTLNWLKNFSVKVSLLLRMGLQQSDGTFNTINLNQIAQTMLKNIGENIYSVTNNGRILENNILSDSKISQQTISTPIETINSNEMQLFINQITTSNRSNSIDNNKTMLSLSINKSLLTTDKYQKKLDDIKVNIQNVGNWLDDVECEIDCESQCDLKNDLLKMIQSD